MTKILTLLAAVIVLAAGYMFFTSSSQTNVITEDGGQNLNTEETLPTNNSNVTNDTRLAGDPSLKEMDGKDMAADAGGEILSLPEIDDEVIVSGEVADSLPLASGSYEKYSPEKLALAEAGDVVLFFHAPWCPSCRGLESDIEKNLSQIPDGVHILVVDYDSATDLKRKYSVVRQHTLVQVDESGNEVKKLTGLTNTLNQVVGQL